MQIKGFQKFSLLDYPEKICAIVFTPGCTLRCPFCYNPELVANDPGLRVFAEKEILAFLAQRRGKLEGLVITGGEPTLQRDFPNFILAVKALGYLVKVDTNGTQPVMLRRLIAERLVDYIAMDIKTDLKRYPLLKPSVPLARIYQSAKLLSEEAAQQGIAYEFRTTVVPKIVDRKAIENIGKRIQGAERYALQQYRPEKTLQKDYCSRVYSDQELKSLKKIAQRYVKKVELRGI